MLIICRSALYDGILTMPRAENTGVVMAFRFSLEQVLVYRERLEQQAKIELARVERERIREQRRADEFQTMIEEQTDAMARLTPQQRDERWLAENFIKGLRIDLSAALTRVRNWESAAEAARRELLKRSIDKKTLEKLKAKQAEQYAQDERLREQKQYDETASLRFNVSRY